MRLLLILASVGASVLNTTTSPNEGPVFDKEEHYIAYKYADGSRDLYTYDSKWRLVIFEGRDGKITTFDYAADGSVKAVAVPAKKKKRE